MHLVMRQECCKISVYIMAFRIQKRTHGANASAPMSAVYRVTPPRISSLVPLMYRMLVSVSPIQTTSETAELKGASEIFPLGMFNSCQVVFDLCVVQL
jgi:hypothetical protein